MEPDPNAFKPLLQPLLDAEGSTYKLVPQSGVVWNYLQETLSPELFPHQENLQVGDPRQEEQNSTLLLVANLGYNPKRAYRGFPSVTSLFTHQLLSAARSHSLFHKYGLVRMLIWVDEDAKRTVLPRTILRRRKGSIEAEITCSEINEIISANGETDKLGRDHRLELESSFLALDRMKEAGTTTPTARRHPMEIEAAEKTSDSSDMKLELPIKTETEQIDLEQQFAAGKFAMFSDTPEGRLAAEWVKRAEPQEQLSKKTPEKTKEYARLIWLRQKKVQCAKKGTVPTPQDAADLAELEQQIASGAVPKYKNYDPEVKKRPKNFSKHYTPEFARLHTLRSRRKRTDKQKGQVEEVCLENEALISMREKVKNLEGPAAARLQEEIDNRYDALMDAVRNQSDQGSDSIIKGIINYMLDNRTAFHQDPPLLYWDRRRAEPLHASQDEFFPQTAMALLDFQPRSLWPILREGFPANYDVLEYILSSLFMMPSQDVKQGITSLAPGAFEWLVPECPSITDPNKGGSPHLDVMGVRCLTQEMLKELVEAWIKWPFKPNRYEVLSKMGSEIHEFDSEDSD